MGTSTASNSEATINTSTESASTLVTNVTSNTDTETCDSLDLGENSGLSEPLLSSLDEPSHSISSQISPNHQHPFSKDSDQEVLIDGPASRYPKRQPPQQHHLLQQPSSSISEDDDLIEIHHTLDGCANNHHPRTAPISTTQSRFPFDNTPPSPRSVRTYEKAQSKFTFDSHDNRKFNSSKFVESSSSSSSSPSSVSANTVTIISSHHPQDNNMMVENQVRFSKENRYSSCSGKGGGKGGGGLGVGGSDQWEQHQLNRVGLRDKFGSKKRINSAPIVSNSHGNGNAKDRFKVTGDSTMFPFDREAIDYDRIQRECFAVEEETKFTFDLDTDPDSSPIYEKAAVFQSPSKSSYKKSPYFYESSELLEHYNTAKKDDIFSQYAFLSQQEQKSNKDKDRRSPNMKRSKYQNRKTTDAFTPKPSNNNNNENSDSPVLVMKFDQIANKFDQIPPNISTKTNNKLNAHYSGKQQKNHALSPTLANKCQMSPTSTIVRITPPLPDLRVDFFASSTATARSQEDRPTSLADSSAENGESDLDSCQKPNAQHGSINVTPNPMEGPVCTQPRATIVVQQVREIKFVKKIAIAKVFVF